MYAIGAGFGRTGTESLRRALDMLDLGPTHHMFEVIDNPVQKERWRAVANGAPRDWGMLLEGYHSAVDWPAAYYWRELMEVYPEAKVILTLRDSASWWQSFSTTILKAIQKTEDPDAINRRIIAEQALDGRPEDREHVIAVYEEHVRQVRASVDPQRLIELEIGSGWEPICTGLGVPQPEEPYPFGNTAETFQADGTET